MSDEEERLPESMSELLASIEQEWQMLMQVVEKMDEAKMTTPDAGGWTPKDNLAHLAEWLNVLMGYHMDRRPRHDVLGVAEAVTADWNIEIINPVLFERNRNRSTRAVLDALQSRHAELLEKLRNLTFDDLLQPRHADDPEKRPVLLWVMGDTSWHYAEHRKTVEALL